MRKRAVGREEIQQRLTADDRQPRAIDSNSKSLKPDRSSENDVCLMPSGATLRHVRIIATSEFTFMVLVTARQPFGCCGDVVACECIFCRRRSAGAACLQGGAKRMCDIEADGAPAVERRAEKLAVSVMVGRVDSAIGFGHAVVFVVATEMRKGPGTPDCVESNVMWLTMCSSGFPPGRAAPSAQAEDSRSVRMCWR